MKHYNRAGLRRGAPPHTEPIGSPMDTTDKPTYPKHRYLPVISFSVLTLLLSGGMTTAATLTQKTDSGTLNPDNSGYSMAQALSDDGSVIGGTAEYTSSGTTDRRAVLWTGPGWTTKTDLGTLRSNNSGPSAVIVLSPDGNVAAGNAQNDAGQLRPVVWSGPGWATKTDLGTLRSDNSGGGSVSSMSADASVIGGVAFNDNDLRSNQAAIWSGPGWTTKTALGTLRTNNQGNSYVTALSADGMTATGYSQTDGGLFRGVIWSGNNWSVKTELAPLLNDGTGFSFSYTLSDDGRIAGGNSTDATVTSHPTIWKADNNWSAIALGTLKPDKSGNGSVMDLSADGSVAAGMAASADNPSRPVIWSGTDWSVITDLGTLKSDNGGRATARRMSANGQVIVGDSETDDGGTHAVIWKVSYQDEQPAEPPDPVSPPDSGDTPGTDTPPVTPVTPTPEPAPGTPPDRPIVSRPVDVDNTHLAVARLAADTFSVLDMQRQALMRLQRGCLAYEGDVCWSVQTGFTAEGGSHDTSAGFSLGYGVTKNLSVGVTVDTSLSRSLPDSYRHHGSNTGAGLFTEWHTPMTADNRSEVYIRPSVAFNRFRTDVRRPAPEGTEAGKGTTRFKGVATALEGGMRHTLSGDIRAEWHVGTEYTRVTRSGWHEGDSLNFPLRYDDAKQTRTTVYAGAGVTVPVTTELFWVSRVDVARKVAGKAPEFRAGGEYMPGADYHGPDESVEGYLGSGLEYRFRPEVKLAVMPWVARTGQGETDRGLAVSLGGTF